MNSSFGDRSFLTLAPNQRHALTVFGIGLGLLAIATLGAGPKFPTLLLIGSFGAAIVGSLWFFKATYGGTSAGIKNDHILFRSSMSKGAMAWVAGVVITLFYVALYWFPQYIEGAIRMMDPLSHILRRKAADQWFLYGSFYTLAVVLMGVRAIYKYRHSRYQIIRTISVMFFQLIFAYLIPAFMLAMNRPEFYFSYFWPLKPDALYPWNWQYLTQQGQLGYILFFWGLVMSAIATPVLTYFYGKRWYCSWVCGCGGLAETLGDPYRHLSDKRLSAWKFERWLIHGVLVFVIVTTVALWANYAMGGSLLGELSQGLKKWYGFLIGAAFSGVIGVGFYPLMGSRVWCRFGCPMAAILGLIQRFKSRFRITTNGAQCISCGNCSKYCEMGIDVRWYAQRGQNIVRASCVGCGVCSAVCPRGVLSLENNAAGDRMPNELKLIDSLKSGGTRE